jgi:hypothetical protein
MFFYYLLLLIIMVSWTNIVAAPPLPVRIMFLVAVLYPGLNDVRGLFVAALTCFWSIASLGYAYSYMPTMPHIYVLAMTVGLWLFWDRHKQITSRLLGGENSLVFFFLIYVWLCDAYTESSLGYTAYTLLTMTMIVPFVPVINRRTVTYFSICFMTITVVLSYYLIMTRDIFAYGSTGFTPELDRIGWSDQNYLGMGVGMGATVAFTCLMHAKVYRWYFLIYSLFSFGISIPVLLMLGSRTALMCLIVSVLVQLMFSKAKKKWKALLVIVGIGFLYYLYTNEYFELLANRAEAEDGTGSNRMLIWTKKLVTFINNADFSDLIFGIGKDKGVGITPILGMNNVGFHNDFLAFFVSYGIIGITFFTALIFRPLKKLKWRSPYRTAVIANSTFLILGSLTLEPFFMDLYPVYAFLFYTLLLTKVKAADA